MQNRRNTAKHLFVKLESLADIIQGHRQYNTLIQIKDSYVADKMMVFVVWKRYHGRQGFQH